MLLAIDIGNTQTVIGLFKDDAAYAFMEDVYSKARNCR